MKNVLLIIVLCLSTAVTAQVDLKQYFKFATFYGAVNGGTSISDVDVYSISNGLETSIVQTPFDYNIAFGVRKIARFGYENKVNTFYDGTENSWSDGASIGKVSGLEFLAEANYTRQQGNEYLDQHHFLRYVADSYIIKGEYLENGAADIKYFETSQRYRYKVNRKLSLNIGAVQRMSEPYGYDPLAEWVLSNGDIHYTYLAIKEGYTVDVYANEYKDPSGNIVATSVEIWEGVVIPTVLSNYVERKRNELKRFLGTQLG